MRRTEAAIEQRVVRLIALGYRYGEISNRTGVAVPTIKKIKKRSQKQLNTVQEQVIERHVDEVSALQQKTYHLINRLLDKDEQGLISISIRDLLTISSEMHRQTAINAPQGHRHQKLNSVYKKYL